MRKLIIVLVALLTVSTFEPTYAAHFKKVQEKMSELNHKKRMKKAAKQDPGAAKRFGHK